MLTTLSIKVKKYESAPDNRSGIIKNIRKNTKNRPIKACTLFCRSKEKPRLVISTVAPSSGGIGKRLKKPITAFTRRIGKRMVNTCIGPIGHAPNNRISGRIYFHQDRIVRIRCCRTGYHIFICRQLND